MALTSIHILPCKVGSSERHNLRNKELDYVSKERTPLNEHWVSVKDLPQYQVMLAKEAKDLTGRAMQKKATPIREGVVVITGDTTMQQLRNFGDKLETKYGVKTLQVHIHRDEGHQATEQDVATGKAAKQGEYLCNNHAHMVFDWMNHTTGKSVKLNRQQMSEIQTLLADTLGMERGVSSDKEHLSAIQYKEQANERQIRQQEQVINKNEDIVTSSYQRAREAQEELARIEAPLTEIVNVTKKNVLEPLNLNWKDGVRLLLRPEKEKGLIRKKMAVVEENYKQVVRARQLAEQEVIRLKIPRETKNWKITEEQHKALVEGKTITVAFTVPNIGEYKADLCWDKEKQEVSSKPNAEWEFDQRVAALRERQNQRNQQKSKAPEHNQNKPRGIGL
jgi:hypothetical protein